MKKEITQLWSEMDRSVNSDFNHPFAVGTQPNYTVIWNTVSHLNNRCNIRSFLNWLYFWKQEHRAKNCACFWGLMWGWEGWIGREQLELCPWNKGLLLLVPSLAWTQWLYQMSRNVGSFLSTSPLDDFKQKGAKFYGGVKWVLTGWLAWSSSLISSSLFKWVISSLLQVLWTVIGSAMNLMPHLVQKAHSLSIVHLLCYKLGALCCFCE